VNCYQVKWVPSNVPHFYISIGIIFELLTGYLKKQLIMVTLDDQVFSRHSGESRNPEGFAGFLDSGSSLRYAE
jgi:hypothetical protein